MYGSPPGWSGFELDRTLTCCECDKEWEQEVYFENKVADATIKCPFCEDGYAFHREELGWDE